ncbi:alpha/beta hydrolase [Altericista sp. CCNU0014]|uniref:alpha/beta hydrolase n=1 Tax=Altericista sp. CCNU0014 TaxID=3082949 RepID=UPI00384AAF66
MKYSLVPASIAALSLFGSIVDFNALALQLESSPTAIAQTQTMAKAFSYKSGINRVTFQSNGVNLVGNLYLPANYKAGDRLPAVIVSGSWTTVKEQMAGEYAQKLADRGFAALAFDSRSFGESGGKLRNYESPSNKIADIKNAITFLQTVDAVNGDRIAGLGICAGAGYMTAVAAEDDRLKALIAIAPWIHDSAIVNQVYGGEAKVKQMIQTGRNAAEKFAKTGQADYVFATSKTDKSAVMFGEIDYYQNTERGAIPQWNNRFAVATWAEWLTFNPTIKANRVKIPTLFVHSEKAAIPNGAKQFFAAIPTKNKTFVWANDYQQFDFYDRPGAMDKAIALTTNHLKASL